MDPLPPMIDAAIAAGAEIACIYAEGCEIDEKADGSPVTIADHRAEAIILKALAAAFPDIPVIAEEEVCAGRIPDVGRRFFLVDPLDGTRGFADRTGEFTVNISLIEDGEPVAGVIQSPDTGMLYYGAKGQGAFRRSNDGAVERLAPRERANGRLAAIGSRNHRSAGEDERLAALGATEYVPSGSSLKFCLLAEGGADVYSRWGRTMEWDTAAGHAILAAAGGRVMALDGEGREAGPLRYGKPEFENSHFIAWAR